MMPDPFLSVTDIFIYDFNKKIYNDFSRKNNTSSAARIIKI